GLDSNNSQSRAVLLIAHLVAAGNLFGIGRFGDVVRHDGALRPRGRLDYRSEDIPAVGRELQIGDRLTGGRREGFALLAFFALGPLLSAVLRALADSLNHSAPLLFDVFRALVAALLRRWAGAASLLPLAAEPAPANTALRQRGFSGR